MACLSQDPILYNELSQMTDQLRVLNIYNIVNMGLKVIKESTDLPLPTQLQPHSVEKDKIC